MTDKKRVFILVIMNMMTLKSTLLKSPALLKYSFAVIIISLILIFMYNKVNISEAICKKLVYFFLGTFLVQVLLFSIKTFKEIQF